MKKRETNKKTNAQKRLKELKGFYIHLTVYLFVNTMITVVKIVGFNYYGEYFMGPIWHFSTFSSWLFWGLGLLFHAIKVFGFGSFLIKEWEEKKIKKYIEEDRKEFKKYK